MGKVEELAYEVGLAVLEHELSAIDSKVDDAVGAAIKAHNRVIQEAVTIKNTSGIYD